MNSRIFSRQRQRKQYINPDKTDISKAEDKNTFIDALTFNWIIGGTDAHAKNYSLLIGGGGLVRLALLYDLGSIFGYSSIDAKKAKLAMKIGDEYALDTIGLSGWRKLATSARLDGEALVFRIQTIAGHLPALIEQETTKMREAGIAHTGLDRLQTILPKRARRIATL